MTIVNHNSHHRRHLLYQMLQRDIAQRYRGSVLGALWAFITPLLLLAVYTFVFTIVFPARWGDASLNSNTEQPMMYFALLLFSGLILHSFMSEIITRAPTLIVHHANLVKKVVFPIEILPIISAGNALFHLAISYAILAFAQCVVIGSLSWEWMLLPVIIMPFMLLLIGISYIFAALGVFIRDIGHVLGLLMTILLFLSPIFYPASALPEPFAALIYLNPLTFIIESSRAALFMQGDIMWDYWALYCVFSFLSMVAGAYIFKRCRPAFADVL